MAPDQESRIAPVDQSIEDLCTPDLNGDLVGEPISAHVPEDDSSGTGEDSIADVDITPCDEVHLEWFQVQRVGAGLANLGNTCFLNTVIQCLTYCPPLANYLLQNDHCSICQSYEFCMMCELQRHVREALEHSGDVIKPTQIYENIKLIAEHFQSGQQEDAHEFLRFVIENLRRATQISYSNESLGSAIKETTVVNYIFGGYNRSQVVCLRCKKMSNTYEHFMDIILDIKQNANSLERALEQYVKPELLEKDNAYNCPDCKAFVPAQKTYNIHRAPNVATIQLKRFDYIKSNGGKITKHVSYPELLDLSPFMSEKADTPIMYRLNAVLVHTGQNCNSGHYYCYIRNSNGSWYLMDDAKVSRVGMKDVLNQQAYLLFYVRAPMFDSMQKTNGLVNGNSLRNGKSVDEKFSSSETDSRKRKLYMPLSKWASGKKYHWANNRRVSTTALDNNRQSRGNNEDSSMNSANGDCRMNGNHNTSAEDNCAYNDNYKNSRYNYHDHNGHETNTDFGDGRFPNRGNFFDRNKQQRDYSRSREPWNGNSRRQSDVDNRKPNGYASDYDSHYNGGHQYNGRSNPYKFYRSNSDTDVHMQNELGHRKNGDELNNGRNINDHRWSWNRTDSEKSWGRGNSRMAYRNETGYASHQGGNYRWRNGNGFRSKPNYYNSDTRYNYEQERNGYRKFHEKSKSADFFQRPRHSYPYYNQRRHSHLQKCF